MNLPQFSIRRPVTVLMGCLIAILLGAIAFISIPVDLMPEIVYPTLSVSATYEGVAPEEMETLVTRPLEQAFAAAPGVEEITSRSSEGASSIRVAFSYGTDLDEAANELRSRLDRRRASLPDDMDPPVIYKFDVSQFPIMFLSVASTDMNPRELRHFVEKSIQYRLERVPGVAQFNVRGGLRREIHVDLDLRKIRALDLSLSQVVQAIQRENMNRPVGPVNEGRYQVLLRTQGEFQNVEQLRHLVVATRNTVPITLRDVAWVEDSNEDARYRVTVDGNPAIRLFIYKQSGANTVQVSDGVHREIERIHRDFPNVRVNTTMDTARFIRMSIDNVKQSAAIGALLAVLILLFFLRSFGSTLVIGVSIPIAVIATFALMYFSGFTLNTVSFGGLALGVGMLVDNSIVVLENIFRHREGGAPPRRAAIQGSSEVAAAVTASTLTTVAVFVPVVFTAGMSGQAFKQLAYVVSFALLCSLIVALTVVPAMSARMLREPAEPNARWMRPLYRVAGAIPARMAMGYGRLLGWALAHRAAVALSAIGLFAGALMLAPRIGVELQPEVDEGEVRVDVDLEPGTRVETTDAIMQRLARIVRRQVPETEHIMIESGTGSPWRGSAENEGELRISLVDQEHRGRSAREIADAIRPKMQIAPGMAVRTRVSGGMFRRWMSGGGEGDRLAVEIRGYDLGILQDLANRVRRTMGRIPGVAETDLSLEPGTPEMLVRIDRAKAGSMGLNAGDIADTLETAIGGTRAAFFRDEGDEFDILVRLREQDRLEPAQVAQVPLTTPSGRTIPAGSVIAMQRQEGPASITRKDQQRIVTVSGTIDGRDLGSVVRDLGAALRQVPRPEGYEFSFGGEDEEQQKSFRQMTFAALLALALVYMVMAAQFESLRDPLIVLFSIPLAAIGVVGILLLTGTTLNVQGFLGMIVLVGIVVNNAIVLIDYMNLLRREHGMGVREAVVTGASRRLRPVLMTTATTVLGLSPMALGIGEGGELQAPLARVVIGGLVTSTLITLVIVPLVYQVFEERAERARERAGVGRMEPFEVPGD